MKLYQYNKETGVYAGELFEDSDTIKYDDNVTQIKPPEYGSGQVPVFDKQRQEWEIMPSSIVRQLLIVRNT